MEYSRASAVSVNCGVLKIKSVLVLLLTYYLLKETVWKELGKVDYVVHKN